MANISIKGSYPVIEGNSVQRGEPSPARIAGMIAALGLFLPSSPPLPRNATTPDFCSATLRRCRHSSQLLPCQDLVFLGFV
jgi:hypothetical protein